MAKPGTRRSREARAAFKLQFKDVMRARHGGDVGTLTRYLQSPSHRETRVFAARSLGRLKNPLAVDSLLVLLDDSEFDMRAATIGSLGRIGDGRAIAPLIDLLRTTTDEAEMALILRALHKLGAPAPPDVVERLASHPNPRMRKALARASGRRRFRR